MLKQFSALAIAVCFVALIPGIYRFIFKIRSYNLHDHDAFLPNTYTQISVAGQRISSAALKPFRNSTPDVTAIVLNYNRFPNVVRIVTSLCSPSLDDTVVAVVVWNNGPRELSENVRIPTFLSDANQTYHRIFRETHGTD
jgi:hypothetical protein